MDYLGFVLSTPPKLTGTGKTACSFSRNFCNRAFRWGHITTLNMNNITEGRGVVLADTRGY